MNVLDLFSGIGGFSIGLEQAGMKTAAFCEVDKKAQLVLKKHWPNVPIFSDVREVTKHSLLEAGISQIDLICGGFPCQDISLAGKGEGLDGERSGLWFEFHRIIAETRPAFVIAENVAALRSRGLDRVLMSLAEIGYDAEWYCIPASAVGAPHQRDRIWIVAYPSSELPHGAGTITEEARGDEPANGCGTVSNPASVGRFQNVGNVTFPPIGRAIARQLAAVCAGDGGQWATEPDVGRVADGVPARVDRLKQLGNAVVPEIPHIIGNAIRGFPT